MELRHIFLFPRRLFFSTYSLPFHVQSVSNSYPIPGIIFSLVPDDSGGRDYLTRESERLSKLSPTLLYTSTRVCSLSEYVCMVPVCCCCAAAAAAAVSAGGIWSSYVCAPLKNRYAYALSIGCAGCRWIFQHWVCWVPMDFLRIAKVRFSKCTSPKIVPKAAFAVHF